MTTSIIVTALVVSLVATALALCREIRLRQALQKLVGLLLTRWRTHIARTQQTDADSHVDDNRHDQRL